MAKKAKEAWAKYSELDGRKGLSKEEKKERDKARHALEMCGVNPKLDPETVSDMIIISDNMKKVEDYLKYDEITHRAQSPATKKKAKNNLSAAEQTAKKSRKKQPKCETVATYTLARKAEALSKLGLSTTDPARLKYLLGQVHETQAKTARRDGAEVTNIHRLYADETAEKAEMDLKEVSSTGKETMKILQEQAAAAGYTGPRAVINYVTEIQALV